MTATAAARTLVDEFARCGLSVVAIAPGSRSAPLALAFTQDPRVAVHVFLDERSAAFFALGWAKATGRPAVALCTSGTAATHFSAACVEARLTATPLILLTADRPPELRSTGAGQTIDQIKLFGDTVRFFADVDPIGGNTYLRSTAVRAWQEAVGPPGGPIHLNTPYREPLIDTDQLDAPPEPGRQGDLPWTLAPGRSPIPASQEEINVLADLVAASRRGIVVAGWSPGVRAETMETFCAETGFPLLADPLSNLRCGSHAISTYEALFRAGFGEGRSSDLVIRLGGPPTSKLLNQGLDPQVPQVLVDPFALFADPGRGAAIRLRSDPDRLLDGAAAAKPGRCAPEWTEGWLLGEQVGRVALDELLDSWDEPFEGRVARDTVASVPLGSTVVVGSSMPVRDVEAFAAARVGVTFIANRGANGIDGFVSTALGVAAARAPDPTVCLLGDLTLLHDQNGLLWVAARDLPLTFVVIDNNGGGIFSFLPQADLPEHFETLFGTPHGIDIEALLAVHSIPVFGVKSARDLKPALAAAIALRTVGAVLVCTDRATNVRRHRQCWAAVRSALDLTRSGDQA